MEIAKSFHKVIAITIVALLFLFQGILFSQTNKSAAGQDISLTIEEKKEAASIYFNTCAGCHGTLRKGATGPALLPKNRTKLLGAAALKVFMTHGTPGGMPDWGKQGILSEKEIDLLARFIQLPPPPPPEMSLQDMKKHWKILVPLKDRPSKPQHQRNWENFFGIILRDVGQVAIVDGDTKELLKIVKTGFAVHILRSSTSGRYFYSIGRDGKVTLIDLWMKTPNIVAEGKVAYDARSVEVSKYKGKKGDFTDKYIVVGGYWPPHFVVMNGLTLEPLKVVSSSGYTCDENEYLREARVAAIVAAHHSPTWIINIKETGMVWIVDYSDLDNLQINMIKAERFLHDGGWDASGRYFMVAANARNKVCVIDCKTKKLVSIVETGIKPHPGRGVNIKHKKYGRLWGTGHLGENIVSFINTDAKSKNAWKVVKKVELPGTGGGNLFVKSHPKSKHIWVDRPLNPDIIRQRSVDVIDKKTLKVIKTLTIPKQYPGRAVHFEYNKQGDEVWVSAWGKKDQATAILVYDDKTLKLKKAISGDWVRTPTGHFNVYNTREDIY